MKILYYSPHPNLNLASPSGPGTHMREVIEAFENEGNEVVKLIMGGETTRSSKEIAFENPWYKKIAKFLLPEMVWQTLKDFNLKRFDKHSGRILQKMIDQEKPDIIYERGYYLMKGGIDVSKFNSLPHIIEINAPYPEEKVTFEGRSLYLGQSKKIEHYQISNSDLVVVVSSALKNYLVQKYPRDENKIVVTPNAFNPESAHSSPAAVADIRTRLNLLADHKIIGFVGSIFRYHGVDKLLESFSRLIHDDHRTDCRLIIVGDGMVLPELKEYSKNQGLNPYVHFVGNVPHEEVYHYIELMDIAIMASSNWYGSPVKVFEYGAMNKAIIAPDNIPLRDVMVNGQDGLLVGEGKDEVLQALRKLLNNQELARQLADSFHNRVLHEFTWSTVAKKILSGIAPVLNNKRAARDLIPGWNKKILVIRTDFSHHGSESGYKQLLRYISPAYILGLKEGDEELVSKSRLRYQWLFEFSARKFKNKIDLIHVMYAEDYLRFSPMLFPRIPVVATFHQPPDTLEIEISSGKTRGKVGQYTHWLTRSRFRKLAAAIVTEENQKAVLSKVMPPSRIHVIPLGVHLSGFHRVYNEMRAKNEIPVRGQIITVGNWLRDWKFYISVLQYCQLHRKEYVFHLINRKLEPDLETELTAFSNLQIHRNISDSDLKKMLYLSRVHFLPVSGASGNNALMEGLAIGCPAVMTDVVSPDFPLRSESVRLYKTGQLDSAMICLDDILNLNEEQYLALKESTFARSIPFDWKEIATRTLKVYQNSVI